MEITIEPEIIFNPVTGEKLLILESNAAVFKFGYTISPRSAIAGEHLHPHQQQTITVTAGKLNCRINGVSRTLCAGDSTTIPPGARHFQSNPTDHETWAVEEYRPAGRIHAFFRVLFTLTQEGETDRKGVPKPLIGAALLAEFKDTVRPTALSLRLLFGLLAPLSRWLGYRQTIRRMIEKLEAADTRADRSKTARAAASSVPLKEV